MAERVAVPMMINEIKNAKKGDILTYDGKKWIPSSFDELSEGLKKAIESVKADNQKTLIAVSQKLEAVCTSYEESQKAYALSTESQKRAFAVSMAFNKIAIDEVIGDSECEDFEALKDWYNEYIKGTTTQLSDDKAFISYFALFIK
jgi:hypothetical protein